MSQQVAQTRLYVILARAAPVAAILRRGPSKWVQLIRWSTASDTFQAGQWFRGSFYERRCDLSPDGTKLVYFAGKQKPPIFVWTAVSTVPYFTALALWAHDSTYGGGGLFESDSSLVLDHYPGRLAPADGFSVPRWLTVRSVAETLVSGSGSIEDRRLARDGWEVPFGGAGSYRRPSPAVKGPARRTELVARVERNPEPQGPWDVWTYAIRRARGELVADLGRLDWADWDRNGDLLFARGGTLFRLTPGTRTKTLFVPERALELADFSANTFEPLEAPPEALRW